MAKRIHLSLQRLDVLAAFRDRPSVGLAGADLMRITGLAAGSLYPMLYVFEKARVLESEWETEQANVLGRPRRRLYRLTSFGEQVMNDATAKVKSLTRISPQVADA